MPTLIRKIVKSNDGRSNVELLNWAMNQLFRAARSMDLTFRPDLKVTSKGCDATAITILRKLVKTKKGYNLVKNTNPNLLRGYKKP